MQRVSSMMTADWHAKFDGGFTYETVNVMIERIQSRKSRDI